jgi:hypothetical protein
MTDSDEIIPDTKLNRILTVSLSELENYKIYCGYGGNELKLDPNGECHIWFESINPVYKDYLFKIPYGRPRQDVFGDWNIVIKKKQFINLPKYWEMNPNQLAEFINKHHLYKVNINVYHSNHPELAKYEFVQTNKIVHNNMIIRFELVEDETDLYDWVLNLSNSGKPVKLTHEEVSKLKIWAGTNGWMLDTSLRSNLKSIHSILSDFSFSIMSRSTEYTLLIIKKKYGGSRKRKNRINRKSRK